MSDAYIIVDKITLCPLFGGTTFTSKTRGKMALRRARRSGLNVKNNVDVDIMEVRFWKLLYDHEGQRIDARD